MPSRRRRTQAAVIPSSSMVASAVTYSGQVARIFRGTEPWQMDAYRHYRICGEARYAASYYGHAMSKAILFAAKRTPEGIQKQTSGPAYDRLEELFNGKQGQAQMLEALGLHLTIAGECYLVGRKVIADDEAETTADLWEIVSIVEMVVNGDKWAIRYEDGRPPVRLTDADVVIRIWRPDPAERMKADSPFRSLLPILDEIEWLTMHVFAQVRSRLAGAGLTLISQDIDFPRPPAVDGKPMSQAEGFMQTLGNAMTKPLKDPSSPESLIPTVASVPGDQIEHAVKHINFWSPLDENAKVLRDEAIHRFALGMDLPPETVMGLQSNSGSGGGRSSGVNHWGMWQIEESTIKLHVEPTLELVCNALIMGYLRPLTEDPTDLIRFDTSALRLRPDRSKEALTLYQQGVLGATRMLEENGFSPSDIMDEKERAQFLLFKVASGSATPDQVGAALKQLGVDLGPLPTQGDTTRQTRPDPTLEDIPTKPRTPDESALLYASEALVYRALERAGNRIKGKDHIQVPGVNAYEMHTLHAVNGQADQYLEDAWSCAPQVLQGLADPAKTVIVLNAYVKSLFATQQPHTREQLSKWLEASS